MYVFPEGGGGDEIQIINISYEIDRGKKFNLIEKYTPLHNKWFEQNKLWIIFVKFFFLTKSGVALIYFTIKFTENRGGGGAGGGAYISFFKTLKRPLGA